MKATKVKQKKFNARRKHLMRMLEVRGNGNHQAVVERVGRGSEAIVFQSELDYLYRCILDYPNIETGGQLFGYWTSAGVPVVMYAIGPGPRANHQSTFFNQDVEYLVQVGRLLKDRRATVGAFLCDGISCHQTTWTTIAPESPLRVLIDRELSDVLVHPRANYSSFRANNMNETRSVYAPGYWLAERGAGTVLNNIITYLKGRNRGADVKPQLNGRGEVQVRLEYGCRIEDILFPNGFPDRAPLMMRYRNGILEDASSTAGWTYFEGDILHSFIAFYENN